jgi:outer membrane immunogenic protein
MERMQVSNRRNFWGLGRAVLFARHFRIVFSGFLLISMFAAGSNAARAADLASQLEPSEYLLPPPSEYTWNGFYGGINVGGGVDHFGFEYFLFPPFPGRFSDGSAGITALGPVGGVQFGANYTLPFFNIVAGIEIDNSAAGISGQTTVQNSFVSKKLPYSATFATRVDDFGTARLRLGYAWGRFLPYLTAGFTYGVIETGYDFSSPRFFSSAVSTAVRSGVFPHVGNGGMGVEYAIDSHFTVKTEYLYDFIDARRVLFSPGDETTVSFGTRTMYHIVRLGLNYKFDWQLPVLAPVNARY